MNLQLWLIKEEQISNAHNKFMQPENLVTHITIKIWTLEFEFNFCKIGNGVRATEVGENGNPQT